MFVSRSYLYYTFKTTSARKILTKLKKCLQPTDQLHKLSLSAKYQKLKKVPKDGLPPAFVTDMNELTDKRLSRSVRAEETFNPADLSKGGVITLPPGMGMISTISIHAPGTCR